jgi:multiple sugar transport system substrate-binding protein
VETLNRRGFLASSGCMLLSSTHLGVDLIVEAPSTAALRVLRWKQFVQGDVEAYLDEANRRLALQTHPSNAGVSSSSAARLLDISRLCNDLAARHGVFYAPSTASSRPADWHRLGIVPSTTGVPMVFGKSQLKALGFDAFPRTAAGFSKMFNALRVDIARGGMPPCTEGGESGWVHWLFATKEEHRIAKRKQNIRPDYLELISTA